MEGLAAPQHVAVTAGQQYSHKLETGTICVLAVNRDTGAAQVLESSTGAVNWTVPAGNWEIVLPKWQFRSGTVHSSNGGSPSLMDYLNPEAGKQFVQWTFDAYKQAVGDEMGKTVLGFRGDEPHVQLEHRARSIPGRRSSWPSSRSGRAMTCAPTWRRSPPSPSAAAPRRAAPFSLDETHRVYADFCDVWSDLYGENFFGQEGKWCAENHVEMQTHIEHEENLPNLAGAEGDFFKCMRGLQIPGIDTIQHQIWHDVVADFPKLASSSTHLNGHPRAMCEAFAAYKPAPDLKEAAWILNHLLVNGINRVEYMGLQGTGPMRGFYGEPGFPTVSAHVNRLCYLLGEGRPAAQVGVYIPSSSFWFNDLAANTAFLAMVHQLLQHHATWTSWTNTPLRKRSNSKAPNW